MRRTIAGVGAGAFLFKRAFCDAEDKPELVVQADEQKKAKKGWKTPMQFENLKNHLQQANVYIYDGFRCQISKAVTPDTQVNHFFWMGSQSAPNIYQYRIIPHNEEEKWMINVATDPDFNIEGEAKMSVNPNLTTKSKFTIGDQSQNLDIDLDITDNHSATQLQLSLSNEQSIGVSYMQAILPHLSMGGSGMYNISKHSVDTAFGGVYDDSENVIGALWDKEFRMMYMRRVNPNRVHVSTELVIDKEAASSFAVGAEYTYKQGRLQLSVDNNLSIKSSMDTNVGPGMNLQLIGELSQFNNQFKMGASLFMG